MWLIIDKEINKYLIMTGLYLFLALHFSCSKEDQSEVIKQDFISHITGDWKVDSYSYSNPDSPDTTNIDIFNITSGSTTTYGYQYIIPVNPDSSYIDSQEYNISDGDFCKLSKVDRLQDWSIQLEGGDLMLHASSHCGGYNESFEIIFTNLSYNMLDYSSSMNADILLVNQYSEIGLEGFIVYQDHIYEGNSFNFTIRGGEFEYFHFVKY